MRIATVNVNGLRAAMRKGMGQWLKADMPDVILLQEVRAPVEVVEQLWQEVSLEIPALSEYRICVYPCDIKGRAGVAVASRYPFKAERRGLSASESAVDSGRWLEVDVETEIGSLTVVSLYAHSGEVGTEKMDQKYAHLKLLDKRFKELFLDANENRQVVVAGDFNIARTDLDIKNWKTNHNKTAGVIDAEIAHLDYWIDELGWCDVVRQAYADVPGPYSWWSWRGRAFDNNAGWRIDYVLTTPGLAQKATNSRVAKAADVSGRWSDHAPVVVDFN